MKFPLECKNYQSENNKHWWVDDEVTKLPRFKKWLIETGIDWDLEAALFYNEPKDFHIVDVLKVLAFIEGERDGESWFWVLKLNKERFVCLEGWCDYTGWDCQSNIIYSISDTPLRAIERFKKDYDLNDENYQDLKTQIKNANKNKHWREKIILEE